MADEGEPMRVEDQRILDQQRELILSGVSERLADFGAPRDEIETVVGAVRTLARRQVGSGSSCDAQVGVSVSEGTGGRCHLWLHVTWTGLNLNRHSALMAELGREFSGVMGEVRKTSLMPHVEFVTWSSLRGTSLAMRLQELATEEGYEFCGVWLLPELVRIAA